jgi:paraquat-inducible protein A
MRRLPAGEKARCVRCGTALYRSAPGSIGRSLGFSLAALFLFVIAQTFPFLTFEMEGLGDTSTLLSGARGLYEQGVWPLAILVLLVATIVPLMKLLASVYVLLPLHLGRRPAYGAQVFRLVEICRPWSMMEVYLLGLIVAYVKLSDFATLELDIAVFAFVVLIVLMIAADAALEPHEVWQRFGRQSDAEIVRRHAPEDLASCHGCSQVVARPRYHHGAGLCPRCGASLHRRKPDSLARTWALLIAAAILYIPANVLPVMRVISFGKGQPDTILSGVRELLAAGMWPVALLVFFASITVPVLKIIGLVTLLVSVRRGSSWRTRERTRIFRIIEGVGRWSMVDIFMISILVALVSLGKIATIEPGPGAISFAAVVILTMIASMSFDPRLMWDARERKADEPGLIRV